MSRSYNKRGFPPKRIRKFRYYLADYDSRGDKFFTPGRMRVLERKSIRQMIQSDDPDNVVFQNLWRTADWDWTETNVYLKKSGVRDDLNDKLSSIFNYGWRYQDFASDIACYKKHRTFERLLEFPFLRIKKIRGIIVASDDPLEGLRRIPPRLFERYINSQRRLLLSK